MEKVKKLRSKKGAERTVNGIIYAVLVIISIVWLIPFVILFIQSLRGEPGGATPYFFPRQWTFNNYIKLFTQTKFPIWYGNTLLVSVVVTVVQTIIVLMTSYALSRLRFKIEKDPFNEPYSDFGHVPRLPLDDGDLLHIEGNRSYAKPFRAHARVYGKLGNDVLYFKGFFDTIPKSLDEAARIDGANRHTVFFKIILPLAKPIIIYTVLTAFTAPWGEYMFSSFIMLGNPDKFTVAVGMKEWIGSNMVGEWFTTFCAAAVVVSIPITALFIWLQRYYVECVTGGAVKG